MSVNCRHASAKRFRQWFGAHQIKFSKYVKTLCQSRLTGGVVGRSAAVTYLPTNHVQGGPPPSHKSKLDGSPQPGAPRWSRRCGDRASPRTCGAASRTILLGTITIDILSPPIIMDTPRIFTAALSGDLQALKGCLPAVAVALALLQCGCWRLAAMMWRLLSVVIMTRRHSYFPMLKRWNGVLSPSKVCISGRGRSLSSSSTGSAPSQS